MLGRRCNLRFVVDDPVQRRAALEPEDGRRFLQMSVHESHRHRAKQLHALDAVEARDLVANSARPGFVERDRRIRPIDVVELNLLQQIDGVERVAPGDDHRECERDADDRQRRLARPPLETAQHHARRGRHAALDADAARETAPKRGRCGRTHGLGRRESQHRAHRADASHEHGGGTHHECGRHHPRVEGEAREWKLEEPFVHERQLDCEPESDPDAKYGADQHRRRRERHVVRRDPSRRETERAQHGDLLALDADQPQENRVQQERRDTEKDGRNEDAGDTGLRDLVRYEPVRQVIFAAIRAEPAVAFDDAIHALDDVAHAGTRCHPDGEVVERSFEIEGRRERAPRRPHDPEAAVVGEQVDAAADLVHELGRDAETHDAELLTAPVDDRTDDVADVEAVRAREGAAHDDLVATHRRRITPALDHEPVQHRSLPVGHRDEAARHHFGRTGDVEHDVGDDAALGRRDTRNRGHAVRHRKRRAPQRYEHIREALLTIVAALRLEQVAVHAPQRHEQGDAGRHDERHGRDLTAVVPEIAGEFAAQDTHRFTTTIGTAICARDWFRWKRSSRCACARRGGPDRRSTRCA